MVLVGGMGQGQNLILGTSCAGWQWEAVVHPKLDCDVMCCAVLCCRRLCLGFSLLFVPIWCRCFHGPLLVQVQQDEYEKIDGQGKLSSAGVAHVPDPARTERASFVHAHPDRLCLSEPLSPI